MNEKRGIRRELTTCIALALPAILIQAWLVFEFSGFDRYRFMAGALFALCFCALLVLLTRWRVSGRLSWLPTALLYVAWTVLVLCEAVSYSLQDDTFNDRFFAHLDPRNFDTGLHGFPLLIGGGVVVLVAVSLAAGWSLRRLPAVASRPMRFRLIVARIAAASGLIVILLVVDSTPARLADYFVQYQRSFGFADTPEGQRIYREIDPDPPGRHAILASPGRNLVWIYMESLERVYTDPKVFPGLTPNLDRLRAHSLDFPGFEQFHGTGFTMAAIFASQCGAPFFSSPFAALDTVTSNNANETNFQRKLACFGDVLHRAGYDQIYLGGAPIDFSNKWLFFHIHGYDQAFGQLELEQQNRYELPHSGWGLYDSDLFRLAAGRYHALAKSGRPFNLTLLTLDTHPPHARPSPGCPRYQPDDNAILQGVHCTDYLIGKFIDDISRDPAFKDTTVVIMSDHERMVTEGKVPAGYDRHPLLFVLNAGVEGVRDTRIYHMDIAPMLLHLLGVSTNARFIAGEDRSAPNALDNPLPIDKVSDAVLRDVLWQRKGKFHLCEGDTLLAGLPQARFNIGGIDMGIASRGERHVSLMSDEMLGFVTTDNHATPVLLARTQSLSNLKSWRGKASLLLLRPMRDAPGQARFSIDWLGRNGALTHLADVPRLQGLQLRSPDCASMLQQADAAPAGQTLDFSHRFTASADAFPELPASGDIDFTSDKAYPYETMVGWQPAFSWGSFTQGDYAEFGFRMSAAQCRDGVLAMTVRPFLVTSRPQLDVEVLINGKPAKTWHFEGDSQTQRTVSVPVHPDATCRAIVRLDYRRPGAAPPPYPKGEDPRALQLVVYDAQLGPAAGSPAQSSVSSR